jgi:hypothetical protein
MDGKHLRRFYRWGGIFLLLIGLLGWTLSGAGLAQGRGVAALEDFEYGPPLVDNPRSPLPWTTFGSSNLDVPPLELEPDPDVPGWEIVSGDCHGGEFCVRSGLTPQDDLRASLLDLTVTVLEDGEIAFWVRNESEAGFDGLIFFVDGERFDAWTGEIPWEEAGFRLSAGEHRLQWIYIKDVDTSVGADAAWLDDIQFPPLDLAQLPSRFAFPVYEVPLDPRAEPPSWQLGLPQTGSVKAGSFTRGTVTVETPEGTTEEREALREYSVQVPAEGAEVLALIVQSREGGNLDLYGRAGPPVAAPPETRFTKSDFAAISPGGTEILVISNPKPGATYWFIVENLESFDQTFEITAWLLPEIRDGSAGADGRVAVPPSLPPPLARYLQTEGGLLGLQQYRLVVPEDATRLIVRLAGEGDLNLHIRFGEPVGIDEETGQTLADVSAISPSGTETIVLAGNLLREGTYYLAIEGLSPPQEFTLLVTLDTPTGSQTMTLSGTTPKGNLEEPPTFIEFP